MEHREKLCEEVDTIATTSCILKKELTQKSKQRHSNAVPGTKVV